MWRGEIVHVGDAHAARVDQLEEAVVVAHQVRDAIARDAGLVVDDGDPHAGEPIQHAAFADVGPADDDDLRNAHGNSRSQCEGDYETARRSTTSTLASTERPPTARNPSQTRYSTDGTAHLVP